LICCIGSCAALHLLHIYVSYIYSALESEDITEFCREMETTWNPFSVLDDGKYIVCVLNQPVLSPTKLITLWRKAQYRATVDGGTSLWLEIVNNSTPDKDSINDVPNLITGDFDSADMSHVEHYRKLGAKIVKTPDQDYTDFTKCLQQLDTEAKTNNNTFADIESIFAFVESSGRLDQIMANIQTLFLAPEIVKWPVMLMSSNTLSWMLPPGQHQIKTGKRVSEDSHCGIIPIDGKAVLTTSGLKWNLKQEALRFGDLVSTSNGFDLTANSVKIITDKSVLWTMDFL